MYECNQVSCELKGCVHSIGGGGEDELGRRDFLDDSPLQIVGFLLYTQFVLLGQVFKGKLLFFSEGLPFVGYTLY